MSSYLGEHRKECACPPGVNFFRKSWTMPILATGVQQPPTPHPPIPLGKAKAGARCAHRRDLSFQLFSGLQICKDAWTPGQGGRKEKGKRRGERKALWREESRDQRAEKLLLRRGHKGHKPAKGREGCFSMPVRKKAPGSGWRGCKAEGRAHEGGRP